MQQRDAKVRRLTMRPCRGRTLENINAGALTWSFLIISVLKGGGAKPHSLSAGGDSIRRTSGFELHYCLHVVTGWVVSPLKAR